MPRQDRSEYSRLDVDDDFDLNDEVRREGQSQQIEMARQDEDLDELHGAVQRLGNMSLHISSELDSQNTMLDDLNQDTDKATQVLNEVTRRTRELVRQSGGIKLFCVIIWLTLLLVFLTYLVLMS